MDPSTITEVMAFGLNEAETSAVEALLHAGGLAHPFPQIEKLRSSNFTAAFNLYGRNLWAVKHENSFDPNTLKYSTNCNGFI
jgi:alcohol dehydrogenase YqhD (iron-dependent ADH family)